MAEVREEYFYMAKLAEEANRYEQMVEFMEMLTAAVGPKEMTLEERNFLALAYKYVIGAPRDSWQMVSSIQEEEESRGNEFYLAIIRDYRAKIESEITSICDGILRLLDTSFIPSAADSKESKAFFLKMKGDYHRYIAEIKTGAERKDAVDSALAAYESAQDISVAELSPAHPDRVGLALNFSVFYYEIMNSPDRACSIAKQAIDEALVKMKPEMMGEESYKNSYHLLHAIQGNLDAWNSFKLVEADETKQVL